MIRELPIAFSDEMVQAVREDRKFMTRRIVNPQPDDSGLHDHFRFPMSLDDDINAWYGTVEETGESRVFNCPYGDPGDILYVRETYYQYGHWEIIQGVKTAGGKQKWQFVPDSEDIRYSENPPKEHRKGRHRKDPATPAWHKRLARFMPKKYSRLRLKVKEIRVERLRDIVYGDAKKEGIKVKDGYFFDYRTGDYTLGSPIDSFISLWDIIHENGDHMWVNNPWVWVVCFDKIN